ncbi:hypothetical protein D3C81_2244320 [compost metagenome]
MQQQVQAFLRLHGERVALIGLMGDLKRKFLQVLGKKFDVPDPLDMNHIDKQSMLIPFRIPCILRF